MGIFDRSSSSTTQVDNTLNQPIQVSGGAGPVAAGVGGDVTIINTDQNAFDDATRLAETAIGFANRAAEDASRLSLEQSRLTADVSGRALDFGENAIAETADAARDFAGNLRSVVGDVTEQALSFVRGTTESQQRSLGETVTALNVIARESSKSTDERVAEVSAGAQKTVLYAVLGLAAAVLIYAMVKK